MFTHFFTSLLLIFGCFNRVHNLNRFRLFLGLFLLLVTFLILALFVFTFFLVLFLGWRHYSRLWFLHSLFNDWFSLDFRSRYDNLRGWCYNLRLLNLRSRSGRGRWCWCLASSRLFLLLLELPLELLYPLLFLIELSLLSL